MKTHGIDVTNEVLVIDIEKTKELKNPIEAVFAPKFVEALPKIQTTKCMNNGIYADVNEEIQKNNLYR